MLRQVFRLEQPDGTGPFEVTKKLAKEQGPPAVWPYFYGLADALPWLGIMDTDPMQRMLFGMPDKVWKPTSDHPHHNDDVPRPDPLQWHEWKVGCKDEAQLHHWFPPSSFPFLSTYGFELVIYECDCDHIHFGTYQLLFCIDHVTIIERRPLNVEKA